MSYVQETLLASTFGFAIVTLIVGLFMLIAPHKVHSLATKLDVFISTEKYFALLDNTKNFERFFYQHHHYFGIFIVLAALYTLIRLVGLEIPPGVLPEIFHPVVSEWIYDAFIDILLLFNSLAIILGFVIFFRPSALKNFEARMNQWIDSSRVVEELDSQRFLEQQKPLKWPRLYGLIVLLASVYILWQTFPYVFK